MDHEYTPFSEHCNTVRGIHRLMYFGCNSPVTKAENRRCQLRKWIKLKHGNVQASFAEAIGKPAQQINDMLKERKSFGEKVADDIYASQPEMPKGYLDWPCRGGGNMMQGAGVSIENGERPEESTPEEQAMEVARQISALVEAWLTLPRGEREPLLREIVARSLPYREHFGPPKLALVEDKPDPKPPTPIRSPRAPKKKGDGGKK